MNQQTIEKIYNLGKKYSGMSMRDAVAYGWKDVSKFGAEELIVFEAGVKNAECPRYVTGWRYGNIPACGHSYNSRDDRPESGVSVVEIDGEDNKTQDLVSLVFLAANRPVVKISGWLNTVKRGADGEPLFLYAEVIK